MKYISKTIFAILCIFFFTNVKVENSNYLTEKHALNPFDTISFDKVIAYDYDGVGEISIVVQNNLIPSYKIKKQTVLTSIQYKKLNSVLGDNKTYGGTTAACFEPHLGIVYYKKNKIVGHISICLACNYHDSKPEIPAQNSHKTDLCDKCYAYGYSKIGRKQISEFVKEINFSHWELKSGLFDK